VAVRHGIELGGSVLCADCTGAKRARRRTHLGRRGRLGCGAASARRGEAERRGGATPASGHGRHEARAQKQAARVVSSPPYATPGRLHGDEEVKTAGNGGSGASYGSGELGAREGGI
jgi:hypothetical protein